MDIGPETMAAFAAEISSCRTVFWNGPMGRFEVPAFARGTEAVARAMDAAATKGVVTVVGGGSTACACVPHCTCPLLLLHHSLSVYMSTHTKGSEPAASFCSAAYEGFDVHVQC